MAYVLACDLGGTSFRAALVDDAGSIAHLVSIPCAIPPDSAGISEVDPDLWWLAFGRAVAVIADAAGAAFAAVEAIAISAITRTQIFLDADGRVLRPAITWRDSRAEPLLPALRMDLPRDHPESAAISAFHPLARLHWLAVKEPACFAAIACVLEPKDYLNFRLTGRVAIDTVAGARLISAASPGPGGRSLFDSAGLPSAVMPQAFAPTDIVGTVQAGLAGAMGRLAGRPVLAMATDTWAAVLGLGALRPGFAYNLSGTTEVLGVLSGTAAPAEGLLTVDWGQGLTQIGGPSQNGADTLAWLLGLLGRNVTDPAGIGKALDQLLDGRRDAQPLLFLPYLQGERTPYWDPSLRGAFVGLNRRHGPVDLAHAVLEGVAFLNRIVLDRAEAAAGRMAEIRFGGGGAANARWCQIKADVTGRQVVLARETEPGLIGAAIVAFAALGHVNDLADGQARLVAVRARFMPRADAAAVYDPLFALFRETEQALAPVSRRLARAESPV